MKLTLLFFFIAFNSWGKPVVLLGHFDSFGGDPFNNSERVATLLLERMKDHPELELKLCKLQTVFDKSFHQLEDCLKDLPEPPKFILGLGESNCNLKIETMVRNRDNTKGPDNEGNERKNEVIIPGSPEVVGLNYPLASMYCSLGSKDRKELQVSNNAGSFVCNNLAFQFTHSYPELNFGFIHVPANNCRRLERKTRFTVNQLEKMILSAVKAPLFRRLPTGKDELEELRRSSQGDQCLSEFYKRTKGSDEKDFWKF